MLKLLDLHDCSFEKELAARIEKGKHIRLMVNVTLRFPATTSFYKVYDKGECVECTTLIAVAVDKYNELAYGG